jgi:hypothetical protein
LEAAEAEVMDGLSFSSMVAEEVLFTKSKKKKKN